MLTVKPIENNSEEEIKTLICRNDEQEAGYISFRQYGYIIDITDIRPNPADNSEIKGEVYTVLDTIIRAMGSYALNHSCFYLESKEASIYPTLEKLRFSFYDGKMKSNLRRVLGH